MRTPAASTKSEAPARSADRASDGVATTRANRTQGSLFFATANCPTCPSLRSRQVQFHSCCAENPRPSLYFFALSPLAFHAEIRAAHVLAFATPHNLPQLASDQ
jgi:hypothetical protein